MSDVMTRDERTLDRLREVRDKVAGEPELLEADPQGFLGSLGIQIDDASAASLQQQVEALRRSRERRAVQAGSIHIDIF